MELKKYVLVNKRIIDTQSIEFKDSDYYIYNDKLMLFRLNGNDVDMTDKIDKTSNNILDLVEVGDLIVDIVSPKYVLLVNSNSFDVVGSYNAIEKKHIKVIYKRQPNGDYKRYEVQK